MVTSSRGASCGGDQRQRSRTRQRDRFSYPGPSRRSRGVLPVHRECPDDRDVPSDDHNRPRGVVREEHEVGDEAQPHERDPDESAPLLPADDRDTRESDQHTREQVNPAPGGQVERVELLRRAREDVVVEHRAMPSKTAPMPETIISAPANTASPVATGDTRCCALPARRPSLLMQLLPVREPRRHPASARSGPPAPPHTGDPLQSGPAQPRSPLRCKDP